MGFVGYGLGSGQCDLDNRRSFLFLEGINFKGRGVVLCFCLS